MYSLLITLLTILVSCQNTNSPIAPEPQEPTTTLPGNKEVPQSPTPDEPTPQVEQEIKEAMEICGNKLSDARKHVVAEQLYRITSKYMQRKEHKDAFIGLVCIESKFDSTAKSSAGAVGMAQLMPKLAPYFARECGLGHIEAIDLADTEVNLMIGACHFSKLLNALGGNIALALAGYNSGQDSETTKRLAKLAEGHPETMAYVAKFYAYINKLQLAREKEGKDHG